MSFGAILDTLLLGPLKLVFEVIFNIVYQGVGNIGLTIFLLSMTINVLVLPLYMCADKMQEKARKKEEELKEGLTHIKKVFSGDEKMMMVQTYYRQNNYSPLSALSGAVSLLLEIPFFMAAFQFLSKISLLNGASLGPIDNLAKPDSLITIGSFSINVLPVLMTVINIVSSSLYLKGAPLKSKIQLYAMATFFLVFLYNSPAGLVFYWTLNNAFSLVKNIFYKLNNPKKKIRITISGLGILILILVLVLNLGNVYAKVVSVVLAILMQIPLLIPILKSKIKIKIRNPFKEKELKPNKKVFILGSVFLAVLIGVLIPSNLIAASPQEFVDLNYFRNPLGYILRSTCMAVGTFLIWLPVFYWLAGEKGKAVFCKVIWVLCCVTIVDYLFFGRDLGNISSSLQFDERMNFKLLEIILNSLVVIILAFATYVLYPKLKKALPFVLIVAILSVGGMSVPNMTTASAEINKIKNVGNVEQEPSFSLSKNGNNTIVIMMDRAMGAFVPYIFKEKPELAQIFDGFTYYDNVISYAYCTKTATPALLGGYEYTPVEINKRGSESLKSKQNEAHKVMPQLFINEGYNVTVADPIYLDYQWVSNLEVLDDVTNAKGDKVTSFRTIGYFMDDAQREGVYSNNNRNFFCFSFMKTMPVLTQRLLYNYGNYNKVNTPKDDKLYSVQTQNGISKARGISNTFMNNYLTLINMSNMTNITEDGNNFLFFKNNLPHEPMLLDAANGYVPKLNVDNTEYDKAHADRFTVDGKTLTVKNYLQMSHYHSNMSMFLRLGEWLNYLKAQGVYDNTKIILASDHGRILDMVEDLNVDGEDMSAYFPLLMVKERNASGFTTSHDFMTNADIVTLATNGDINNPINPYTNKPINNLEKTAHEQFIILSHEWNIYENRGNRFMASKWASVKDNIWEKTNWSFNNKKVVLKEHSFN